VSSPARASAACRSSPTSDQSAGARLIVRHGQRHRIAGVAQADEIRALHHATVRHVEAGNDAFGQHARNLVRAIDRGNGEFPVARVASVHY